MASILTEGLGQPFPPLLIVEGLGEGVDVIAFTVASARSLAALAVRVTFSNDPLAFDPAASDDALNISNYILTGPVPVTIVAAAPVTGDQRSIDLYLGAPLQGGAWTVEAASSIRDVTGVELGDPRTASFDVVVRPPATGVAGGAQEEGILRRHFNPALHGDAWDALILAVEGDADNLVGHTYLSRTARAAYDQLFLGSASSAYLDKRAAEGGVRRPDGVGLQDEPFRELALALATQRLTHHSLHDVLEVFYGLDAVRATLTSGLLEPFTLRDGDDLQLVFGRDRAVTVTFQATAFARIATATAVEVAATIERALRAAGIRGRAAAVADPTTGLGQVRIYADARGIPSAIRVVGGRAQVALRLPNDLYSQGSLGSTFGSWNITTSPTAGRLRLSASTDSPYDLSRVDAGDQVLIYGREFPTALQGTHEVLEVSVSYPGGTRDEWIEIEGTSSGTTVSQVTEESVVFLRSTVRTIHDQPNRAYVTDVPGGLEAVLPATTTVVARGDGKAAYLAVATALAISAIDRDAAGVVTITTTTTHGLATGDRVLIDGVMAMPALPASSAGTPSGTLGASHLP